MIATSFDTARDRLHAIGRRFAYGLGVLLAFAIGSIGAFLLFEWPPLLKEVVLAYLMVFLIIRLVLVLGRFLLAPGAERFRVIPMATASAQFWFVWSAVLVGWFVFIRITLDVLAALGVSRPAGYLVGLMCGVVLVGLSLYVVWRHPDRESGERISRGHRVGAWLLSLYLIVVWLLLFTGSPTPFYVGVILLLLPIAIRSANLAVAHVLRPADSETADAAVPSLAAVTVDRGLRAALLIGGAYLIAWLLGLDLAAMTMRDTMATRLLRGAINAVVILLLAEFAWHLARTWIDRKLAEAPIGAPGRGGSATPGAPAHALADPQERPPRGPRRDGRADGALGARRPGRAADRRRRRGRGRGRVRRADGGQGHHLRHVLPARRRVPGRRVHHQRQLQRHGKLFSLRSIKLRHHRGYLYTVPFGELGAVQNMSRDWVIDKLSVSVTYDTDLDKVKKVIKEVSKELMADPELAANVIEPLKMQGVEQFGDFAIEIRMKMMTKPGEQFVIRRLAYGMIKKAFSANGIEFALPTVTVAGGGEATAAVAQKGLQLVQPPTPTADA